MRHRLLRDTPLGLRLTVVYAGESNVIDVQIGALRDESPKLIQAVRGVGCVLRA